MADAAQQNLELDVAGMTCTACARRVEKSLNAIPGVAAYVDFATETAHLSWAAGATDSTGTPIGLPAFSAAIESAGYTVGSKRSELRRLLPRLLLGIVLAIGIALFSMVPALQHMLQPWQLALLTAPSVLYVAWPFHSAAVKNLRHGDTTMDTLVSLGTLVAFGYSLWQTALGAHEHYFEVAAVVPAVVLLGRYLELRSRRSATNSVRALLGSIPDQAMREVGETTELVAASAIRVGDVVRIPAGERSPVDGELLDEFASLDLSTLTGESLPHDLAQGVTVPAGAISLGQVMRIRATSIASQSRLARIADLVREATSKKTEVAKLTDRISAVFVPTVIAIAIGTLLVWWLAFGDFDFGVEAAIAVLVIACPCALGIAIPMSLVVAAGQGVRRSTVIRDPDSLSKLSRVKFVLLDKTGTLTDGRLRVVRIHPLKMLESEIVPLIAAVERNSSHPIAKAIASLDSTLSATNITERAGRGMSGQVKGRSVEITRITPDDEKKIPERILRNLRDNSAVLVRVDGQLAGIVELNDRIRPESGMAIREISRMKIASILVSGDRTERVKSVAREVGTSRYFGEVTPEGKLELIGKYQGQREGLVAMVGDGLNDVAALAKADIGIAMGSGAQASQSAAALTILDDNPLAISYALRLGRATWNNIRQNLIWAFGYNLVLIPVAAMGLLNPMLAGAAMGLSSISVVLNSLRLRRVK